MKIKHHITLERLIGKIDNDFNISESDWIPRVAAWVIDALSQMKVLPMEKKLREIEVNERVAKFPCRLNATDLKVFANGVEVPNYTGKDYGSCEHLDFDNNYQRYFILDKNDHIIINFDIDSIDVESYEVVTYHDDYYDCDCPYIYDNGLLLEALSWYVMFKYLSRGSSHPVYSLTSSSPITNPAIQWNTLKSKAAASVKNSIAEDKGGWNNFFYNSTFLPRG